MKEGHTEAEIWNLFRTGDEAAFTFIYQAYFDRLFNYGCQFTSDQALVEDTLQELFIELWRRRRHLSETDKILPYLYRAFRRKVLRARDKESRLSNPDPSPPFAISFNAEDAMIADETRREQVRRLQGALDQLSERHREIVFLFFYENLTYEEIREIQGFDHVKSARNLLYKALQSLQKQAKDLFLLLSLCLWVGR